MIKKEVLDASFQTLWIEKDAILHKINAFSQMDCMVYKVAELFKELSICENAIEKLQIYYSKNIKNDSTT